MAFIRLPRVKQQPSGLMVLDRAHPINKDIRFFIATDGQGNFFEYVKNTVTTKNGSAAPGMLQRAYGNAKVAKLASASSDVLSMGQDASHDMLGDISLFWSGQINSGSAFRSFIAKCTNNGANATPYDFRTDNSAAPIIILGRGSAAASLQYSSSPLTVPLNKPATVGVSIAVANTFAKFYVNNTILQTNPGSAITPTASATGLRVGRRPDGAVQMDGFTECAIGFARVLADAEFATLIDNPYAGMVGQRRKVYFGIPQANTTISGVATITLDAVTLAATVATKVQGAAAITLDAVTLAATVATKIQAAAAITLGDVTPSATIATKVQATAAITLDDATLAATAKLKVQATASTTLDDVALIAHAGAQVQATAVITLDAVTLAATAQARASLVFAQTLDDVTVSAVMQAKIKANAAITLDDATLNASAMLLGQGVASITLDDVSSVATVAALIAAALNITLDDVRLTARIGAPVVFDFSPDRAYRVNAESRVYLAPPQARGWAPAPEDRTHVANVEQRDNLQ